MYRRIIPVQVSDEYVRGAGAAVGAAGSHDDVALRLEFGPMWAGTARSIVWLDANGENPVITALTTDMLAEGESEVYLVPIPAGPKAIAGEMCMTIKGATVSGSQETTATLSVTARFLVLESSWSADAEAVGDITATQAEQFQAEIESIKTDIVSVKDAKTSVATDKAAAESARSDAEAAKDAAEAAQTGAEAAQTAAEQAQAGAEVAAASVSGAVQIATARAAAAQQAKNAAETAQGKAEAAQAAAEAAQTAAESANTAAQAAKAAAAASEAAAGQSAAGAAQSAQEAGGYADTAETAKAQAEAASTAAAGSASSAAEHETAAKSWAVGGTGTREGEDTNNARYWAQRAASGGSGGGTDIGLGIAGASAGQVPAVKTVDAAGQPTEWEAKSITPESIGAIAALDGEGAGELALIKTDGQLEGSGFTVNGLSGALSGMIGRAEEYAVGNLPVFLENGNLEDSGVSGAAVQTHIEDEDIHVTANQKDEWSSSVRYDAAQELTGDQQSQARSNIGAAPGGYGFGGEALPMLSAASADETYDTFCTRVDAVLDTMPNNSVKLVRAYPPQMWGRGYAACLLYKVSADYAGLYSVNSYDALLYGFRMIKRKKDSSDPAGSWDPLEWVNPPMALGVEYRTTERYLGKPVYRQVVQIASLTLNTDNTVQTGVVSGCTLVDARIFVKKADGSQTCIPQMETNENATINAARYWLRSSGVLVVRTYSTAEAGSSVTAELAYIKGTD